MSGRLYHIGRNEDWTMDEAGIGPAALKSVSYQMTVISNGIDDAVRAAGGWLCDRVRAGWHVTVVLPDEHDPLPLQILGIRTWTTDDCVAVIKATSPAALAIASGAVRDDVRMLKLIDRELERNLLEVTIWGDEVPLVAAGRLGEMRHRMSCAAEAFKAIAVVAVGGTVSRSPGDIRDPFVEQFHSHAPWYPPDGTGLMPCE